MNIVLNDNMNESSGKAGKGFYPNTELGIDLKLMTKEPGRMAVGEYLDGAITHDGEDHFTFQDFCQGAANELRIISGKSDDR